MSADVLVIGWRGDLLVSALERRLAACGVSARAVTPERLADEPVTLDGDRFLVSGHEVAAIVVRCRPESALSASFAPADQAFADSELRATWLAALALPSLFAVNRLDASAWFENEGWTVWRRRLNAAGVPVTPFSFGDVDLERPAAHGWLPCDGTRGWLPYAGARVQTPPGPATRAALGTAVAQRAPLGSVWAVCGDAVTAGDAEAGDVMAGDVSLAARRAARRLDDDGVSLAELVLDDRGDVCRVDTQPPIGEPSLAALVAERLSRRVESHLADR